MLDAIFLISCLLFLHAPTAIALSTQPSLTSAVLRITYDGTLLHGWTASNDGNSTIYNFSQSRSRRGGRSRRNRLRPSMKKGEIRSVVCNLKGALSKLFGNVPLERIIVEGASRTDKGVHSEDSYALIYCLPEDNSAPLSIEGKKVPHPRSPTDECFKELPFNANLQQMVFALNKMLPPDVRVHNASPMPVAVAASRPFHPSLDSLRKTYRYNFSVGEIHDPIRCRNVWNIPHCVELNLDRAQECADILCGTHDFSVFRGAFRGSERGKVQDSICTLFDVSVNEEEGNSDPSALCKTYCVEITGDRFLYKQVRFLVGTIVMYAKNESVDKNDIATMLTTKTWLKGGDLKTFPRFCAPPHGLTLKTTDYAAEWKFDWII